MGKKGSGVRPVRLAAEPLEDRLAPACVFMDAVVTCDSGGDSVELRIAADHGSTQVFANYLLLGSTTSTTLQVNGAGGNGKLTVNDQTFAGSDTYVIDPEIRIPSFGYTVDYQNLANLELHPGRGHSEIDVRDTITAGLNLIQPGEGGATINVGDNGILAGVGELDIFAPPTLTTLNIDDSRSAQPARYTVTEYQVTVDRLPGWKLYYNGVPETVTLDTGSANYTVVDIQGTAGNVATTINSGAGDDVIEVERSTGPLTINSGGGRTETWLGFRHDLGGIGQVILGGDGSDYLYIDDSNYGGGDTYALTSSSFTVASLARFGLTYQNVATLVLQPGFGANVIDVASTSVATATSIETATLLGSDLVTVGNDGNLAGIGDLTIDAGMFSTVDNTTVILDDSAFNGDDTYSLSGTVTVGRLPALRLSIDSAFVLDTGPGDDFINVDQTPSGFLTPPPVIVNTGGGDNTINVGQGNAVGVRTLHVNGGSGVDTLNIDDSNFQGASTEIVTDTQILIPQLRQFNVTFGAIANLNLRTSAGPNTVTVQSTAAGTATTVATGAANDTIKLGDGPFPGPLSIDGGGGANTLDYSAVGTDVYVNLRTSEATDIAGGVQNIQNVIGGSGNNILVGNDANNLLVAGPGRDVLIGGGGSNTLNAGAGEDILISGTTAYDANAADLQAISAVWAGPGTYDERVADLLTGSSGILLDATTVFSNGAVNILNGGPALDLFYADLSVPDVINNLQDSETVVDISGSSGGAPALAGSRPGPVAAASLIDPVPESRGMPDRAVAPQELEVAGLSLPIGSDVRTVQDWTLLVRISRCGAVVPSLELPWGEEQR